MNGFIISGYGRAEGRQTRFIAWISTRGKVPSAPPCLACHQPADDEEIFTSDPVRVFLFPSHLYESFRSPRLHSTQVKNKNPMSLTARRLLLHRPHDTASAGSTKASCTPIFSSPQCNSFVAHPRMTFESKNITRAVVPKRKCCLDGGVVMTINGFWQGILHEYPCNSTYAGEYQ